MPDRPGAPQAARGRGLGACPAPLCEAYDAALLDLDGVLYLSREPVAHAAASVQAARAAGMRAAFVTNNASRRPSDVAAHLTELGVPASADDVVTSGQASARLARERLGSGATVLVLGTAALSDEVAAAGLRPVRTVEEAGPTGPAGVVQGLAPETSWRDLAEAAVALRAGALWIAGNTDSTLPTPRGPLPGNGSLVAALRTATGLEPLIAGKPQPALHAESVARVSAVRPLVVGDRLDTDILGAVRGGADSLLVLTGVVDVAALLRAPAGHRPTFVAADLRGLLVDHPVVELAGRSSRAGEATARYDGGRVVVRGSGDDAVRAACALSWAVVDDGLPLEQVDGLAAA